METEKLKKEEIDIFSEIDIDLIAEKINKNLNILEKLDDYKVIDYQKTELELKLMKHFDEGQQKILKKYLLLLSESIKYQNALAYYLGIKTMKEVEKLK